MLGTSLQKRRSQRLAQQRRQLFHGRADEQGGHAVAYNHGWYSKIVTPSE